MDAARGGDGELLADDRAHERAVMIRCRPTTVGRMPEHALADAGDDRSHHGVRSAEVLRRLAVVWLGYSVVSTVTENEAEKLDPGAAQRRAS